MTNLKSFAFVFIGGGIGAAGREFLILISDQLLGHNARAILVANLTAAFLIGLAAALTARNTAHNRWVRLFVITGILGGLSTFSTLIWSTVEYLREPGQVWIGLLYLVLSFGGGWILVELGRRVGPSMRQSRTQQE